MKKSYLVTGGSGFLGSSLVRRLVKAGHEVRVFDDDSRGSVDRLKDIHGKFEFISGDIRDAEAVEKATRGIDSVCHLAFVNGTEFFYSRPELVLEVGVKGMINVVDACLKNKIDELILASSSEVYQNPPVVPTAEDCPMVIPNPLNPRYSYAAGKMISEIIAINYGRTMLKRVVIFRPHNVYGPEMGWEHVIPQFILRMKEACKNPADPVRFTIQGTGKQTRSFVFIEDFTDGLMLVINKGEHLGIYHIGTMDEVTIEVLAKKVGEYFERPIVVMPSDEPLGGTPRRCPDTQKLSSLGYHAKYSLDEGLRITAEWYDKNSHRAPVKTGIPVAAIPDNTPQTIQEEDAKKCQSARN